MRGARQRGGWDARGMHVTRPGSHLLAPGKFNEPGLLAKTSALRDLEEPGAFNEPDLLRWRASLTDAYISRRLGVPKESGSSVYKRGDILLFDHNLNLATRTEGRTRFEIDIAAIDGDLEANNPRASRFTPSHMKKLHQKYEGILAMLMEPDGPEPESPGGPEPESPGGPEPESPGGPHIAGGGEERPFDFPVLLLGSLAGFIGEESTAHAQAAVEDVKKKIREYIGKPYNAMVVITAQVYRTLYQSEENGLGFICRQRAYQNDDTLEHVKLLTGAKEALRTHFYEGVYEQDIDFDVVNKCHVLFDLDGDFVPADICNAVKDNNIGVIYFMGGQTHWLHRKLRRSKFSEALHMLKTEGRNLVLAGHGAGCINLGASTYTTAVKTYADGGFNYFGAEDQVFGCLCDENGNVLPLPHIMEGCPPEFVNDCEEVKEVDYEGLGCVPYAIFTGFGKSQPDILRDLMHIRTACRGGPPARPHILLHKDIMCYIAEDNSYQLYHTNRLFDKQCINSETIIQEFNRLSEHRELRHHDSCGWFPLVWNQRVFSKVGGVEIRANDTTPAFFISTEKHQK
jgi:hypothetical protein